MEKALIIKGPLNDLRDLLNIAVAEGRKVLKVYHVNVKPVVIPYGNESYMVVVEQGVVKASDVGSGKKRKISENTQKNKP